MAIIDNVYSNFDSTLPVYIPDFTSAVPTFRYAGDQLIPGPVSTWTDEEAGESLVQATSGSQPTATLDGQHVKAVFDGTADFLARSLTASAPLTIYGVFQVDTIPGSLQVILNFGIGNVCVDSGKLRVGSTGSFALSSNSLVAGKRHVFAVTLTSATAGTINLDGVRSPFTLTGAGFSATLLQVARSTSLYYAGSVYDVAVFPTAHSDAAVSANVALIADFYAV
jgi:hypothetical protein